MSRLRYVLVPGWITSTRDGQRRYVNAQELMRLYRLGPGVARAVDDRISVERGIQDARAAGLTVLFPRSDGDYSLPGEGGVARQQDVPGDVKVRDTGADEPAPQEPEPRQPSAEPRTPDRKAPKR